MATENQNAATVFRQFDGLHELAWRANAKILDRVVQTLRDKPQDLSFSADVGCINNGQAKCVFQ